MSLSTIEDPVFRAEYDTELRLKYPDPGDDHYTGPGSQFDRGVQHALSLQRGESRDVCAHKEPVTQQAGQLWALQSHVDRARNDAAIYRRRCQKHNDELQASDRKLLELQQDLELAKSRMTSLQSSSMEAENETRHLKLSNYRVDKDLQASKDQCASMQRELSQRTASHSRHIDELTLQLENAKKELSMLQGTRSAEWQCLQADLKGKDGQLEAKDQQLWDLRGQLSKQQGQVEQLQAQLDSLCSSVKDSSEDTSGDKKKRGHVVHITATAGPLPHHQPSVSGTPPQEGSSTLEPDFLGKDSRPDGGLPGVEVTGAESAAPAADPSTIPKSTSATPSSPSAAQGPAPAPSTRADPPASMPGDAPAPSLAASGPSPVFGFGPTNADRHAGQPAFDEAPEAQDAGNGDASSAAPAADPNPAGDVADPPAVGGFTFPSSGVTSGFPAFAGATNLTPTFGGASGATTASSASTTAEGGGKGRATAGAKSAARSKAGKSRVKTKAATAVGPTATAATAGADRPTPSFSFSGVDPFAGQDSRPNGALPEMYKEGMVNKSEAAAPAAAPANTPESTPATASSTKAAQGPAPAPITRVEPPVSMPGEPPAPPLAASGPSPVFGFGSTGADRHAGQPASDEAPEAQDAGNGDASQAAPAADPNPFGDAAASPAAGTFTFASSGNSFGSSPFAGAAASTPTFGGASAAATAGSASATAEGGGKGRATAGTRSAATSKPGKSRVKTKAATAAGPTATAATAGADRPTPSFSFSGVDPFAGKDSRSAGDLPEVQVTGVTMSESAAPAADPATTPLSTPAVAHAAHAAQGPAPAPITRAGLSSVTMPGEGPAPPFAASGASPVFGFGSTGADRHADQPASTEAPEAQDAGNGDASSPAPAGEQHPNPSGHAADPHAFGGFSFGPSSGNNYGFSAFAGAAASTPTFGGDTAGLASTTDEGKGRATAGTRSAAKSKAGKSRVKTKAATAAEPTATAAAEHMWQNS